jgi:DNA-binding HxlR family transcriptional regulator
MVKRTSLEGADCPIARSLDVIGDWWSLLIVRDALDGLRRFGEFQKSLGLARNILTNRLRSLVAHGILELAPASDGSAFQEYVLTAKGRDLFCVVASLRQWGDKHFFQPGEERTRLVDKASGKPVARLEVRAKDGRVLSPGDTIARKVLPPGTTRRKASAS